jgi:hypothetical protein
MIQRFLQSDLKALGLGIVVLAVAAFLTTSRIPITISGHFPSANNPIKIAAAFGGNSSSSFFDLVNMQRSEI